MIVTCEVCGLSYDDTYRLTFCPHERFEMCTVAMRGDGTTRVCTSVEELRTFMDDTQAGR